VLWGYAPVDNAAVKHTVVGAGLVNFLAAPTTTVVTAAPTGSTTTAAPTTSMGLGGVAASLISGPANVVSSNGRFSAWWTVDLAKSEATIVMRGTTTGWVSFAIGHSSLMTDIDSITGWVSSSGAVTLIDGAFFCMVQFCFLDPCTHFAANLHLFFLSFFFNYSSKCRVEPGLSAAAQGHKAGSAQHIGHAGGRRDDHLLCA
jgi:hypothetical protein